MDKFGHNKDPWVCPNDRQLALRAKLRSGWSVKSSQYTSLTRLEALTDKEQEAIVSVIKRAEELDKGEQERIGRLMEKWESMKKNAVGNGVNQCVLCKESFGMLGSSSQFCTDCKKAMCHKCGVNVMNSQKQSILLCKICAECRDIWKKSGAWFFRGIPKYISPQKKSESWSEEKFSRVKVPWMAGLKEHAASEPEIESTSDEEAGMKGAHYKHPSKNVSKKSSNVLRKALDGREKDNVRVIQTVSSRRRDSSVSSTDSEGYAGRESRRRSSLQMNHIYREEISLNSGHSRESSGERQERKVHTRRRSSGSLHSESDKCSFSSLGTHKNQSDSHHSLDSVGSHSKPLGGADQSEDYCGSLEFSILYDVMDRALHCTIYKIKGIQPRHPKDVIKPYVELSVLYGTNRCPKLRTKTMPTCAFGDTTESLTFYGVTEQDLARRALKLRVLDEKEMVEPVVLGEVKLPLSKLRPNQTRQFNMDLGRPYSNHEMTHPMCSSPLRTHDRGTLLLSLKYSTPRTALIVGIVRCAGLASMDPNGFSDPFVRVQLKPDPQNRRYKTSTKWKTLNPEFNEEFVFEIRLNELPKKSLEVTVWDKDYARRNDYVGGIQLGIDSKGECLRHWFETIKQPDRRHDRWHLLSTQVFSDAPST